VTKHNFPFGELWPRVPQQGSCDSGRGFEVEVVREAFSSVFTPQ